MAREKNLSTNSFCILIQSNFISYQILKKNHLYFLTSAFRLILNPIHVPILNISRQINSFKKKKNV